MRRRCRTTTRITERFALTVAIKKGAVGRSRRLFYLLWVRLFVTRQNGLGHSQAALIAVVHKDVLPFKILVGEKLESTKPDVIMRKFQCAPHAVLHVHL